MYSSENDSISLRWKPPNLVNGILQYYAIKYYNIKYDRNVFSQNNTKQNCLLYDGYICHTISTLQANKEYEISVSIFNR